LNLLEHRIEPQFVDSIPLASGRNFRPPLYFEAMLYVKEFATFTRRSWHRFKSVQEIQSHPSGRINWDLYAKHEHDPRRRLEFPSRRNILSESHPEYEQLKYVYKLALAEILAPGTPYRIKADAFAAISYLEKRLNGMSEMRTRSIKMRLSDPPAVKSIKNAASRILQKDAQQGKAWRVDFSKVFERFVQYIFHQVAKEIGGKMFENVKFRVFRGDLPLWALSHVEPDAILQKDEHLFSLMPNINPIYLIEPQTANTLKRNSDTTYTRLWPTVRSIQQGKNISSLYIRPSFQNLRPWSLEVLLARERARYLFLEYHLTPHL